MADKIGEGYIEITGRTDKFEAAMAESKARLASVAGAGGGGPAQPAGAAGLDKAGAGVTGTIGLYKNLAGVMAATGATKFARSSIDAGGDMIETMSKLKIVFGDATASVEANVDQMSRQFGALRGATMDTAAQFGLITQAAGLSEAESAKFANTLTRLGDDAASFFNVPLDVALDKIRAGMVGQARPLREFGVLINESTVKAQALAMGFKEVHGQFTEAEKVMARVELIIKGLDKAQGDHMATMGSYQNQMKLLNGEFDNFKQTEGVAFAAAAAGVSVAARGGASKGPSQDIWTGKTRQDTRTESFIGGLFGGIKEAFFPDQEAMDKRMGVNVGLSDIGRNQKAEDAMKALGGYGGGGLGGMLLSALSDNPVAKEQLDVLKKIQDLLANKRGGGGVVVKGRED